jgi:hypothetical protein
MRNDKLAMQQICYISMINSQVQVMYCILLMIFLFFGCLGLIGAYRARGTVHKPVLQSSAPGCLLCMVHYMNHAARTHLFTNPNNP